MLITVELGATIPLPDTGGYGNVKPLLRITDLDPAGDVDAQVELALATSERAWAKIDGQLEATISSLIAPSAGVPSMATKIQKFAERLDHQSERMDKIITEVKRQKAVLDGQAKAD